MRRLVRFRTEVLTITLHKMVKMKALGAIGFLILPLLAFGEYNKAQAFDGIDNLGLDSVQTKTVSDEAIERIYTSPDVIELMTLITEMLDGEIHDFKSGVYFPDSYAFCVSGVTKGNFYQAAKVHLELAPMFNYPVTYHKNMYFYLHLDDSPFGKEMDQLLSKLGHPPVNAIKLSVSIDAFEGRTRGAALCFHFANRVDN